MRPYLGELEQLVLLAVVRLDGDGYGTTLQSEIEARTGRAVSIGALYATLDRLQQKRLVTSRRGAPTAERGGRAKRFYAVTPAGRRALQYCRSMFDAMWEGLVDGSTMS